MVVTVNNTTRLYHTYAILVVTEYINRYEVTSDSALYKDRLRDISDFRLWLISKAGIAEEAVLCSEVRAEILYLFKKPYGIVLEYDSSVMADREPRRHLPI